jgi:hypothetical protein
MQKITTRIFIIASLVFGITGILMVLTSDFNDGSHPSDLNQLLQKLLMICVFIILPSFALSVAGKYLNGNQK